MLTVGIVGAGGFVGHRTAEIFCQKSIANVRPIVRKTSRATFLDQLGVKAYTADATQLSQLQMALTGCDVAVYCASGSICSIRKMAKTTYQAADRAGVKRLVYLSTASVHGQAPALGTDEYSALSDRQFFAYNNAKVHAEQTLLQLREQGTTEVVNIRPGIVIGPASRWIVGFVNSLLEGTAYIGNQGRGICNSVYIDNLVEGIRLALTATNVDRHAFLISDRETITWADLYRPFANSLGFNIEHLPTLECFNYHPTQKELLREGLRNTQFLGEAISFTLSKLRRTKSVQIPQQHPLNYEMAALYSCEYKLPYRKAQKLLGYNPPVSFTQGCDLTLDWLALKGYPIKRQSGRL